MPGTGKLTLVWAAAARDDLVRLRLFIEQQDPGTAKRAAEAIRKGSSVLLEHPGIGVRLKDRQDREGVVPFGARGYGLRYRLDENRIVILRVLESR